MITRIKTLLLVLLIVIITQPNFAQEHWMAKFGHLGNYYDIKDATQQYFREDPSRIDNKACGYNSFNRWMVYMESRVDANGTLNTYKTALESARQALQSRVPNSNYPVDWEVFGPTNNSHSTRANMGLITSIWVNEDNPDTIYAGSNSGGLFVTYNNGQNWQCLTDKYLINGVESIDIHKNRPGIIYIGTGTETFGRACGFGVWKSTNYGSTWNETGLNSQTFTGNFFTKTAQDPANPDRLYAIVNFENTSIQSKILRTSDGGDNWDTNYSIAPFLREIEIDKTNPSNVYVSGSGLYFSNDYGSTWNDITYKIVPDINDYKVIRASVAINPFDPLKVLVLRQMQRISTEVVSTGIMLSNDGGNTFALQSFNSNPPDQIFYEENTGFFKMELEWSKSLSDVFYIGGLWIHKYRLISNNQFVREPIPGDKNSHYASNNDIYHVDIRELKTYNINGDGFIFHGNDGGITKGVELSNNSVVWEDLSRSGLNITQYYGIGIPNDGSEFIAGGTQDGNFNIHDNGIWSINGGDIYENVVDYSNPDIIYRTFPFDETANPPRRLLQKSTNRGIKWENIFLNESLARNDKPIEMSQSNPQRVYVGGSNVWRTNNGNDFQQISNFTYKGKLKSIREAPSNPLVIYAAMENPTWEAVPANNVNRLYKTIDGGNNWVDITPNVSHAHLGFAGITDIAIDPTDPHTFYLTLGNNWTGKKVYKGTGTTSINWTNISEGLFNLPVNCIKLRQVNDLQEIFIGTDDGVYYRNKNMNSWEPFGNGLPITLVSDIDYDYATHQFYVATFGRGIYKADLSKFNMPPNGGDIIVSTNETWSMLKRVPANVIVKQGATLTITGVVKMKESKQIIVEKGAKLIVDGGIIRNHVKDTFWKGIVVYGTDGPQNPLYQGIVALKNNAVIENAEIGVLSKGNTSFSGGGIVSASNATFKNNIKAVEFTPYKYGYSISSFSLCDFFTTTQMPVNYDPIAFVTLESIDGIKFNGCKFINERSTVPEKLGKGIYSHNSYFYVDHKCSGSQVPCPANEYQKSEFIKLQYGIYSNNKFPGKSFKVTNSLFNDNYCGIYAAATSNIQIKLNEFIINKLFSINTGLYLDRCTGYIVEENSFSNEKTDHSNALRGIVVNQSGAENNMIYKNQFHQLQYGIVSQDLNRSSDGTTGLMLKCNIFTGTNWPKYDIAVLKTNPAATGMGIADNQGSIGPDCKSPAGNLFSNNHMFSSYGIYNDGEFVNYFHHNPTNEPKVRPNLVTQTTVERYPIPSLNYSIDCCPPNTNGGGGVSIIDGETAAHKEEADNKTETLNSLIDDGKTADKVLEVNLASPGEALMVRNSLLQISPYVSDTVLKSSIKREELFNNAMIRDIMVANPHSAKSEALLEELDMRLEPMPEYMRDEILEGVFVLSARELMEAKRDIEMQFYNYGFNRLLSAALTDTIPVPVDTLLALLAADGSARSLMQQAWVMLENGDTLAAVNHMTSIPTEVSFTETEAKEHTAQWAFMQWLIQHPEISEEEFEDLSNFVESPSNAVSAAAHSIMVAHNLLEYDEPYLVPDLTKSMGVKKPKAQTPEISNGTIRIYPNPGKDYITIEYAVDEFNGSLYYQLTDQSGKVVKMSNLGRRADQIIIDTRELSSGSYYIKLVSGNKNVAGSQFMIAK